MSSRSLRRLRRFLNGWRSVLGGIFPIVDVLARIGAGKTFLVSGMLSIGDWPVAMQLSRPENALGWLDPHAPAILAAGVELTGSILFIFGLLTRLTAAAMLVFSVAAQFSYNMADAHLLWAALFAWYLIFGAGPISIDAAISRGLRASALPFADEVRVLTATVSTRFGPPFKAALRVWLALAIVGGTSSSWFPIEPFASPSRIGSYVVAGPLALGLATPLVSGSLALIYALGSMTVGASLFYASLLFLLLASSGAGRWSVDGWLHRLVERTATRSGKRPHVVIVGAGFGGLKCASGLKGEAIDVTLIDRNNYHLFQPLLYQVATAGLSPADIAFPIRALFRDNHSMRVLRGTVTGVDAAQRTVTVDGREIGYDHLVLATGATHGYFGHEEWSADAPGLKQVEDAIAIRARVLSAFERAEAATDPAERARLLTFVICGAEPTGVELAGAIADLARFGLSDEFRSIDPTSARIVLLQAGPRVLPTFPEDLSLAAQTSLERMGVEVRLNSRMEKIEIGDVVVNGEAIPAGTALWAAGVIASPAAQWLGREPDSAGRLKVALDLSVPGYPEIFAIGDTVSVAAWNGQPAPGLAPAAKQAGAYVAEALCARIYGDPPPPPFRYRHWGSLATIGRKSAVVDLGGLKLSGAVAWWFWGAVHLFLVVGLRNRAAIFLGWIWSYATYEVGVQLITGLSAVDAAASAPRIRCQRLARETASSREPCHDGGP
jgi:NADH dehydrogenase/putative oxidoreductase